MDINQKLKILADSAKYDVSCSSSGSNRKNKKGIGSGAVAGICHSFSADGRCISLLKILMTNICIFDCKYCINRKSNQNERALFTPEEIADLTISFYRRNYIEGLFLSSGIIKNGEYTMEKMYEAIYILRNKYHYCGYIHVKTIPGASQDLIDKMGKLVDRISINLELPSKSSLALLAPNKESENLAKPMNYIAKNIRQRKDFAQAGQTTQMIVGASNDDDYQILSISQNLYDQLKMKRVYYSAYVPVNSDRLLPSLQTPIPLKRENRLYQADWLLRFYGFHISDLLSEDNKNFNYEIDPKCDWALRHLHLFPVEINRADYTTLLKVPGIGVLSAKKIVAARKYTILTHEDLKRMSVVLKRARYFITCNGKYCMDYRYFEKNMIQNALVYHENVSYKDQFLHEQLTLFKGQQ